MISAGRAPNSVQRSLMTGCMFASSKADLEKKLTARGRTKEQLLEQGMIVGVGKEIQTQLQRLSEAGVQGIMLQWLDLDDLEGLKELARAVL